MHSFTHAVVRAAKFGLPALVSLVFLGACSSVGPSVDLTPTAHMAVDVHLGKGWTADSTRVENITKNFATTDMVAVAVDVPGHKGEPVKGVWSFNGQVIYEQTLMVSEEFNVYRFRLEPPASGHQVGEYTFEIYIDGKKEETERFTVHG